MARQVLHKHTAKIRSEFDRKLSAGIAKACEALDRAMSSEKKADAVFPGIPKNEQERQAYCLAMTRKAINDIFASLDIFRSGYFDLAQGILRSAMEGWATAVLFNVDRNIFEEFRLRKYSVNASVGKIPKRNDLGLTPDEGKRFKDIYESLHQLVHPTMKALATQYSFKDKEYPVGGNFDDEKIQLYTQYLKGMEIMAQNISDFLQDRFLNGRPKPNN